MDRNSASMLNIGSQTGMQSGRKDTGETLLSPATRPTQIGNVDIEKGPVESESESRPMLGKEFSNDIVASMPALRSENIPNSNKQKKNRSDIGTQKGTVDHVVKRKHWVPSKLWFIVVFLGLAACWVPAILQWTRFPDARVWGAKLIFWSIWLSIFWAGWWAALVCSWIAHRIMLAFVKWLGLFKLKQYVNWLEYLHVYLALVAWTWALWITWVPLIDERQLNNGSPESANSRSIRAVDLGGRIFFALACCATILFFEKLGVQAIAMKFHQRSYKRRIDAQHDAVKAFQALSNLVHKDPASLGKKDTMHSFAEGPISPLLQRNISKVLGLPKSTSGVQEFTYHHRVVDRAPTSNLQTAFTDAASQIFGATPVDNDDVAKAFHKNGSRRMELLAREIWSGLVEDNKTQAAPSNGLLVSDEMTKDTIEKRMKEVGTLSENSAAITTAIIVPEKTSKDQIPVDDIWAVLTNKITHLKTINEQEFLTRCSDLHAEQRRLEETMNDLHNVVGRLDDLLVLFTVIISILVFAVALEAELKSLILGAGSAFVGTSWLLRDTASEVLASIIFLFSKHPYDVEDMVIIDNKKYTVVEMRLLSTVFYDGDSVQVQAPNQLLNTKFIHNLRRSPATSEPFSLEIHSATTQDKLDKLKEAMEKFMRTNPKDYRNDFDYVIDKLSFDKMILCTEIPYNNNWESSSTIRAARRNKWICQLWQALHDSGIEGPEITKMKVYQDQ